MTDWPRIALLLAALCGADVLGLSLSPAGCRDTIDSHGAVVIRAIGTVWTKPDCLHGECQAGPDGSGVIAWSSCSPPPYPDCEVVAQNRSAEYPGCCAKYRCPDRCFSPYLQDWFAVHDTWTEQGCLKAHCFGTDNVAKLPCGLIAVSEPRCRAVPGDRNAAYPGCCHKVECDPDWELKRPCYDKELDRHFDVGESWTLPGCSGRATCGPGGHASAVGCPLQATDSPYCSLDDGDTSLEYPQCCPKITCEACHSQQNNRYFGPGDTWTGRFCTKNLCHVGPHGALVARLPCGLLSQPPFDDCELAGEDLERGDYPRCCGYHRCAGRCFAQGEWFSVGDQWNDGCSRAICSGTDRVQRLACPFIRVDPSRPDCRLVEGNTNSSYPACCPTVQCDTPLTECHDAGGASREVGAAWTEPGCVGSQCVVVEGGLAVVSQSSCPPRPSSNCILAEELENSKAEYPNCCPPYFCPGQCFSPVKGRWFAVGDEWTEDGCTQSVCASTGIQQAPCPFVSARRLGCSVVPGNPIADYPGCCHQVECEPNPYG